MTRHQTMQEESTVATTRPQPLPAGTAAATVPAATTRHRRLHRRQEESTAATIRHRRRRTTAALATTPGLCLLPEAAVATIPDKQLVRFPKLF